MKRSISIFLLGLLCAMPSMAQKKIEMPVWGKEKAMVADNSQNAMMTVYLPQNPNGITIMMCPGGGYDHLAITHEGHDMAKWFNEQGVTYIVLKYRLPRLNDTIPLSDAKRAMINIRKHAEEWHINKNKVGIMGGSAGGHLASSLATMYGEVIYRPDFQVLLYPVISMDAKITNSGTRKQLIGVDASPEKVTYYTTSNHVTNQTPPAFIALSDDDTGVVPENSLLYYEALRKHHVRASLHIYPTGGHGWGFKDTFAYKKQWTEELTKWLQTYILKK